MALTEPEAGSDLQNVQLKATHGRRRHLAPQRRQALHHQRLRPHLAGAGALARKGTTDGRGLSMFLYERDEHMKIRRIEDKLGIHGSPTCELQFDDAPALLVGERRRGLTTYVMSLMNGARLGDRRAGAGHRRGRLPRGRRSTPASACSSARPIRDAHRRWRPCWPT